MRLREIKEGLTVECHCCDCGAMKDGVIGKIYFRPCECDIKGCFDAYHEGNPYPFANHLADEDEEAMWHWSAGTIPNLIKIVE